LIKIIKCSLPGISNRNPIAFALVGRDTYLFSFYFELWVGQANISMVGGERDPVVGDPQFISRFKAAKLPSSKLLPTVGS
jgi:hypothetical protein